MRFSPAFLILVACGGSVGQQRDGDGDPNGALPAPTPSAPAEAPTGKTAYGSIFTMGSLQNDWTTRGSVVAKFSPKPIPIGAEIFAGHCEERERIGDCTEIVCATTPLAVPSTGAMEASALGDNVALRPAPKLGRLVGEFAQPYFAPGTKLDVSSEGGSDVPKLADSITLPSTVELVGFEPIVPFTRGKDYSLRWTPVDTTFVVVLAQDKTFACTYDGMAGKGTIDGRVLVELTPKRSATVMAWSRRVKTIHAGEVSIDLVGNGALSALAFLGVN